MRYLLCYVREDAEHGKPLKQPFGVLFGYFWDVGHYISRAENTMDQVK